MNRFSLLLALSSLVASPLLLAQDGADKKQEPKPAAKLQEWPALKQPDQDRVLALVGQFKKADAALHKQAADQLVALGDGVVPILARQVSDRDGNINEHLFAMFDRLVGPQHAALLARQSKSNVVELRRWTVRRLCRFVDPELEPVLQAATKDKEEDIAFFAQVGLLGLGKQPALQPVLDRCRTDWTTSRELCAEVLPHARSEALGRAVAELMGKAQPPVQANCLRLMRWLATKEQSALVRNWLSAEDHNVKKEAVNAMRVLNGEAAIENLSVFDAIKMAKEWAAK